MNQCKRDGCWSYALNDHVASGFCDKCYWINKAEQLTAERDALKSALEHIVEVACSGSPELGIALEALKGLK